MADPDGPRRARLPDVALGRLAGVAADRDGSGAVSLRERRRGTALVLLGEALAPRDTEYLGQLAEAAPALAEWDGRLLVLVADGAGIVAALAERAVPFPVLADPGGTVAAAAGVTAPAIVVVDQWGEVREAREVTATQPWLPPAELEQWMRFLSIQCAG